MNTIEEIKEEYQKQQSARERARKGEITIFDVLHIDADFKAKAAEYVGVLLNEIERLSIDNASPSVAQTIIISYEAIGKPGERRHPAPCQFPEYLCVCGVEVLAQKPIAPPKFQFGQKVKSTSRFYDGMEGVIADVKRTALSWWYTVDSSEAFAKGEADYPSFDLSEEHLELIEVAAS